MAKVVIVDTNDNVIGTLEKKDALKQEQIVRIVRILLFNSKKELFIQQRGLNVSYPGFWDQSAGGHVDEGEDYISAAKREMHEEIGLEDVDLKVVAIYYSHFEYEGRIIKMFNSLYTAVSDKPLKLDPADIADGKWATLDKLNKLIEADPKKFSEGFIKAYKLYLLLADS